jgi:hypothetical protein
MARPSSGRLRSEILTNSNTPSQEEDGGDQKSDSGFGVGFEAGGAEGVKFGMAVGLGEGESAGAAGEFMENSLFQWWRT